MKRAARTDRNHAEVVNAFRGLGCSVLSLAKLGQGCPDLLIGLSGEPGINILVEVKAFPEHTEKGRLNADQLAFLATWCGPIAVVRSLEDVGRLVKAARTRQEVVTEREG